jgi:serine/threonine-protein kinase
MANPLPRLTTALSDRYRIERELGAGGMATVYLAEDLKHKRRVALKVLKPELAAVLGAERFVQEITTTAALQHPHILPLFDSGTAAGFLYYVMPFIDGETLRAKLNRETQFGIDEAVRIATQVADALDYAHRHGVIHRDIKPENILLHDGRPMVADFGIALAVSAAAGGRMTETGLSLGTPHYMSPEQATAEKEITARSDVYSLGSVLYEMLAGSPPHVGASAQQIIMKIVTEEAAPVTKLRKAVPPHVAAAVAVALEKLPADRFATAAEFAAALGGSTAVRATARIAPRQAAGAVVPWRRIALGALGVAAVALAALGWALRRSRGPAGPSEYDVGLPDSAPMWTTRGVGFAVAPAGDFLVYQAVHQGRGELWYRSLENASTRRIPGTEDGWEPAIGPDGNRVAFLRERGQDWTVDVVSVAGGPATTLGRGTGGASLQWLADGRLQLLEADGKRARWFDPGGGATDSRTIRYCIMEAPLPEPDAMLCGGGGQKYAYRTNVRDSTGREILWTGAGDSTPVFGSHFQVVEERYLTYLSIGGDLLAAPVDLRTRRVGRPVRMATGLGRSDYEAAGTYALSGSGTLVYAQGINKAVGHLVRAGGNALDTLSLEPAAFLRFSFSPDGRRLAAVVEGLEGEELRIYDLRTGQYVMWVRRAAVRQPVWSPAGDRLLFSSEDSVFMGSPELSSGPEFVFRAPERFEGFAWMPDNRVVGVLWGNGLAVGLHAGRRPATLDTLLSDASFVHPSPDGRWIAYSNRAFSAVWLEPLPRDGRRYQVAAGAMDEVHWLSASELVVSTDDVRGEGIERVAVIPSADPPVGSRRPWLRPQEFRRTAGQAFTLSQDGRVVYVRGAAEAPVQYLRVIPRWVDRMKRAVDAANR